MYKHFLGIVNDINEDNQARDAYSSINGYFYQFELTLLHILEDGSSNDAFGEVRVDKPAEFQVEVIEDYVKYYEKDGISHIRVAQMKHHSGLAGPSKYTEAVLWLYYNYLKYIELDEKNVTLKAVVYHFDQSPSDSKKILTILEDGMEKNAEKPAKDQLPVYKKIISKGKDSPEVRTSFSENAWFEKTKSLKEVTEEIKNKLYERYQSMKGYHTPEYLYAVAVNKIIEDGASKTPISLSRLDELFSERVTINPNFYKYKIIEEIFYIIDGNIEELEFKPSFPLIEKFPNEVRMAYEVIYQEIKNFMVSSLQDSSLRKSFLNSLAPKKIRDYLLESEKELEAFLECSEAIKNFFAKLAKIIYFHRITTGENKSVEEFFDIDSSIWLFKYPNEERSSGVIMGNISGNPVHALIELIPRFANMQTKPNVWYLNDIGIRADSNYPYKHSITNIATDLTPCNPDEDHFHIQCLNCLMHLDLDNLDRALNIFTDGCHEKGE
ncbi:hypothetical protein [Bacillus pacificus]|uniref:hypothetical protein n=1 Tax=Bacillus pacificus TaxID=2026187 RepID=UPI0023D84CC9|nr:hypothetical protein [Bacillus pacificus]MDF0736470.1 hypothetical protein [Bacillus pacificus]